MKLLKNIIYLLMLITFLSTSYIITNLLFFGRITIPFYQIKQNTIVKKALKEKEIESNFIICKYIRTTGFNYIVVKDESGGNDSSYCLVKGVNLDQELSYDFLTSDNRFIFYVKDKKQHDSKVYGEPYIEYTAVGWDVLYPVKRDSLFNTTPKYVLISDYR